MKKISRVVKFVLTAVVIITFLFSTYILFYNGVFFGKANNVEISFETISDIQSNNTNLVKIGDRLYYNYEPKDSFDDLFTYGLYEITSSGAKRVYWGGPKITDGSNLFRIDSAGDSLIRKFSDLPYNETPNGQIYKYNTFWHNFEVMNELSEAVPAPMRACRYVDGAYFYYLTNALYIQKEDKLEKIIDVWQTDDESIPVTYKYFIESSDMVYYIKPDGKKPDEGASIFCSYTVSQKKESEIRKIELPADDIAELYIDGDKIILGVVPEYSIEDNPLYMTSIEKDGELTEVLNDHSPFGGTIVYDGMVYFIDFMSDSEGLYSVALNNPGKRNMLYEGRVMSIHIFDSQWIYFTDDKEVLYRITRDGKTLEKVFG